MLLLGRYVCVFARTCAGFGVRIAMCFLRSLELRLSLIRSLVFFCECSVLAMGVRASEGEASMRRLPDCYTLQHTATLCLILG